MTWCCEIEEINKFLKEAKPNDIFTYFVGGSIQDSILAKEIGKTLYDYSTRGIGYLVQKRVKGYLEFNHYFVKASSVPAIRLIPFAGREMEHWQKLNKGVHRHGSNQGTGEDRAKRHYSV